jgi:CheY-like chemotaxis protein
LTPGLGASVDRGVAPTIHDDVATTRILVIEDERIIARDICATLEEMGYAVCGMGRSSTEALAQAAAQKPDLVLMDIRIEGPLDGVEAAAELKRRHKVPVVFLTGNTDEGTLQRAIRAEPDGYLAKPFTRATLRSAIEVAIQRRGVEGRLRRVNDELIGQKSQLEKRAESWGCSVKWATSCNCATAPRRCWSSWLGLRDSSSQAISERSISSTDRALL